MSGTSKSEIMAHIRSLIPFELWSQYSYLSLRQMSEVPELSRWSDDLLEAEGDINGLRD